MSRQRSRLILTILMLVSVLTVFLSLAGFLPEDGTAQRLGWIAGDDFGNEQGSGNNQNEVGGPSDPGQQLPSVTPGDGDLAEFPVAEMVSQDDPAGQLESWPLESSIERIRTVDLSDWKGRALDASALSGITIFLDPGHGGQDTGALYPAHSTDPIATESVINLAIAQKTKTELEAMGATVFLIRDTDVWQSIFYRIAWTGRYLAQQFLTELSDAGYQSDRIEALIPLLDQVMQVNSDSESSGGRGLMRGEGASEELRLLLDLQAQYEDALYLSIHCNALDDDSSVRGLQVYYLTGATAYARENELAVDRGLANAAPVYRMYQDELRRRLAGLVHESVLERLPSLKYDGQKSLVDENYAVLRELNLTSVLIELGFISNVQDRNLLTDAASQKQMAQGIAEAVYHYYCLP